MSRGQQSAVRSQKSAKTPPELYRVTWYEHDPESPLRANWQMVADNLNIEQARAVYLERVKDPLCGGVVIQSENIPLSDSHLILKKSDPQHPLYTPPASAAATT